MDMIELRRRVMLSMASGKLPEGVSVVEFEVTLTSYQHTIRHGLKIAPKTFTIIPTKDVYDTCDFGADNPLAITGFFVNSGIADYPYKLISNHITSDKKWDYTASNAGWNADESNIYLRFPGINRLPVGKYVLFAKAY